MEDIFATKQNDAIKLEYGEGIIIMDGSGNIIIYRYIRKYYHTI